LIAAREIGGIKLVEKLNGGKCVRAEKIQQMRGAAMAADSLRRRRGNRSLQLERE